jgi:hypothetical protein
MPALDWFRTADRALSELDPAAFAAEIATAKAQRAAILSRAPLAAWPQITVQAFAGESQGTSLARQIAGYAAHDGAPASSLPLYRDRDRWRFPMGFGDEREAWQAMRAVFLRAFELVQEDELGRIHELSDRQHLGGLLLQALAVYFPERFLPVHSADHLELFGRRLLGSGWKGADLDRRRPVELNAILSTVLRERLGPGLDAVAARAFLYDWSDPAQMPPMVLKVAPGEEGRFWNECLAGGYVCVGWDDMGDLRTLRRRADVERRMLQIYGDHYNQHKATITKKARELWALREASPGAVIVANRGTSHVLGVGRVKRPGYAWRDDREEYKHTLEVDWDPSLAGAIPTQGYWGMVTVREVPAESWDDVLGPLVEEGRSVGSVAGPTSATTPDRPPRWWLFQCNPKVYDLAGALQGLETTSWRVTRYAADMQPGDRVVMWETGSKAGVRGFATLTSRPYTATEEDDDPYLHDPEGLPKDQTVVDLRFDPGVLSGPSREDLKGHSVLLQMSHMRTPQPTNHKVSDEEARELLQLIEAQEQVVIDEPPSFQDILDGLRSRNLFFPAEVVANVILALRTKRFAILTGISGTGKTQIALGIAERYPLVRQLKPTPTELVEGAVEMKVQPYMRKHRRFRLPMELAAQLPQFSQGQGSVKLRVVCPDGEVLATAYSGSGLQVGWKGVLGQWFAANLAEGDTFIARVVEPEGEDVPYLQLSKPAPVARRATVVKHHEVIAVRPDWTDNRGLLGYFNPITEQYMLTPFLRLLLAAREEADAAARSARAPHPFFVVLDEMNLARVEHYFSDFLSALESGEPLPLHEVQAVEEGADGQEPVPRSIVVPDNLFFVGTVNVDETTYMFSPKVLDRAFTIEFNDVDLAGLDDESTADTPLMLEHWDGRLRYPGKPDAAEWAALREDELLAPLRQDLITLHALLTADNRHFGYRVANELARFIQLAAESSADRAAAARAATDLGIVQKVLPKLHGTRQEVGELLDALLAFALDCATEELATWSWSPPKTWTRGKELGEPRFPRAAAKLWRMRRRLQQRGFTSYIE